MDLKIVIERCTFYTFTFFKLMQISVAVLLVDMAMKESNDEVVILSKSILDLLENPFIRRIRIFLSCNKENQFGRRE